MLGKTQDRQQSYFLIAHRNYRIECPPDSFYGRMGSLTGKLLRD